MALFRRIRRFVWGDIPESKAERTLLLKIDCFILSYCCLMVRNHHHVCLGTAKLNDGTTSISQTVGFAGYQPCLGNDVPHIPDLDRSNVSNAYVSGMKQDLHMYGTEFNVSLLSPCACTRVADLVLQKINTIFTCGYIVGMIPSKRRSTSVIQRS